MTRITEEQYEVMEMHFNSQLFGGVPCQEANANSSKVHQQKMKKCDKKGKKGPNSIHQPKKYKAGKRMQGPKKYFSCGSKICFSMYCQTAKHIIESYKARKEHEMHLV